jgi:uncharacterized membrane protein YgcG
MKRTTAIALWWIMAISAWAAAALPAHADSGDVIRDYAITYTIRPDGLVDVVEDIDYDFAGTDRHGIYRDLVTRQPFSPTSGDDVVYDLTAITVSSPDAPSAVDKSTHWHGFRTRYTELKVGDKDTTIAAGRAHYRIRYTLGGALRTTGGKPEFYWNATGTDWTAAIDRVRVEVRGPATAGESACYRGQAGSTQRCDASASGDVAEFSATGLGEREGMTVSVLFPAGSIANAKPSVVAGGSLLGNAHVSPATVGGSAAALLLSLIAAGRSRRRTRDQRFAGTPPGVIAPPGTPIVVDTIDDDTIPVRFNPPEAPPALAGPLLQTSASSRRTATVLVELAAQGVIGIDAQPDPAASTHSAGLVRTALPRDLSRVRPGYQSAFVAALFPPGAATPLVLDDPGTDDKRRFQSGVQALHKALEAETKAASWRTDTSAWPMVGFVGFAIAAVIVLIGLTDATGGAVWIWSAPVLVVAALLLYAAIRRARGLRTPVGRALTDQVVGFRRYLATAEAGQLRFEEGEDIFSAYLPWAIVFDLAERWQRVCAELAASGRIPSTPTWYSGPSFYSSYSSTDFGSSLTSASVSNSGSSGSGGGGSSGGGGGGGGGGSW